MHNISMLLSQNKLFCVLECKLSETQFGFFWTKFAYHFLLCVEPKTRARVFLSRHGPSPTLEGSTPSLGVTPFARSKMQFSPYFKRREGENCCRRDWRFYDAFYGAAAHLEQNGGHSTAVYRDLFCCCSGTREEERERLYLLPSQKVAE